MSADQTSMIATSWATLEDYDPSTTDTPYAHAHYYNESGDGNASYRYYNETTQCDTDQPTLILITQVLYAVVCIVGLLGNSLVIYVVLRFSKMQTVTNMYIVNLAVADECFLVGIPFLLTTMNLRFWPFGNIMCKVYMTTTSINQFTSSIFLTIMSADRYIAVCHPISAPKVRTPLISKVVSLTAWTASALLMVPVFMYASIMDDEHNISCNILWPESETVSGQTAFTLYSFILGFSIPLMLISIFYILVIRKLKTVGPKNKSKEKKKSSSEGDQVGPDRHHSCQSRVAITIFLLAGILSYSNSAMNPILYAFLSDNFKKSFLKACTCATGQDINATLHMENSVFPRRHHHKQGSEKGKTAKGAALGLGAKDESGGEKGPLVSKTDNSTTAITMTSRSNLTVSSDVKELTSKENSSKDAAVKNGQQPTQV
uniref:G-protein coupled receptors family 1 profile domain-containing protein n=1 Tax=Timema genevievae TaxID=629358 RepID=A0A7R9K7G7_TIMGE|nr:unnamed protein product [Timema genevievae]